MNQTYRGRRQPAQRSLVSLAGAVILLLLLNGAIGLYGIRYVNLKHAQALDTLDVLGVALDDAQEARVHFKVQVQEWKNVLLRGHAAPDLDRYAAAFEHEAAIVSERLEDLRGEAAALDVEPGDIDDLIAAFAHIMEGYREALARHDSADPDGPRATDARVRGIDRDFAQQLDALADRMRLRMSETQARIAEEARERAGTIERVSMVGTAITVGLLIVMVVVATRRR